MNRTQVKTHLTNIFFAACLAVLGNTAWGDSYGNRIASQENCPADFDLVDLGRWTVNEAGKKVPDYGGVLYHVTRSDSPWQDTIFCIHPDDLNGRVQMRDAKPVPLVQHFRDGDLGLRYIRKPYGDYVADVVSGIIMMRFPGASPIPETEERNRNDFLSALQPAVDRGRAVAKGPNYTCLFDPENPNLSGDGSYACMVTIDEAPFPHTLVRCGRWVPGCSAEFSLSHDVVVRLSGDVPRHWEEAARAKSIPEAIEFWTDLIGASINNFEASVVSRGREESIGGSH